MKNKKKTIIGILCIALVFMGIGYSLFSSTLNLSGTATANGTFDVKITNVLYDSDRSSLEPVKNNATVVSPYTAQVNPFGDPSTSATLTATFNEPGEAAIWDVTVTNRGTIEAAITVETSPQVDTNGAYKLSCNAREGTTLAPSASTTFKCEMSFDKDHQLTSEQFSQLPKGTPVTMTVTVTAVQKANYEAPSFEMPDYIISNDGVLLYSSITDSSVTVPDSYNGKTITAIGTGAFHNVGAEGLMAMDYRDEENPVFMVFPFGELSSESLAMAEEYGVQIATLDDILSFNCEFDDVDASGGPLILPMMFSSGNPSSNLVNLDLSQMTHLKEIYPEAFYIPNSDDPSPRIATVTFPSNGTLTDIGDHAFYGNNISSLTLPNTLVAIGYSAFRENSLRNTLTIPSSVTSIGDYAFAGSDSQDSTNFLSSVVFQGNNLTEIGRSAFENNNISGTITLPSSVEIIKEYAFYDNIIEEVHLGSNIKNMGSYAFGMRNSGASLAHIYVDMTEATWNSTVKSNTSSLSPITSVTWYNGSPTMHFNQS